jgi:hypothetical protein
MTFPANPSTEAPAMRMPRFRFTVRRMMMAVALLSVAFGLEQMRRKRSLYIEEAAKWSWLERLNLDYEYTYENYASRREANGRGPSREKEVSENRVKAKHYRSRAIEAGMLRRKYLHAARYPWLPVAPDPLAPPWPQ